LELAKVYVSSTLADLTEERRAVLDWLRLARHQAVDSYLPDSDTVRDSCLDDVGMCDLYVLIMGHRYGFQPPEDNPEGLSITHLEFRRAGECGIPRVALLRMSIPDVRLSDLQDRARAPLVLAFRDEVACQVRPAEFTNLQGLIQGLSTGVQAELDKLGSRSLADGTAGRRAVGPVLRLAPRPTFLAGRDDLLAELGARLAGSEGTGPRVVALCGMGGAGKTSVAVEYAHRQLAELGLAWQFPAEDPAVLKAEFAELAAQLGALDLLDLPDPVASVHGALAAFPRDWLLVFDNAPDPAAVRGLLPPGGGDRVVITSQYPHWPVGQTLEVPVLDQATAARFLLTRTGAVGTEAENAAAEALAGELGGLPLALEQAAAYMQAAGRGISEYLGLFREHRTELLARGDPTGYDRRVTTTWTLAFAQLGQSGPAAGLLRLAACYAAEDIPLYLLLQDRPGLDADGFGDQVAPLLAPLLGDELARDAAVAGLRRYSLISMPHDGVVSVHQLVQAVTLAQLPADAADAWRQAAAVLIEAALPDNPEDPVAWPAFAALLPHAQAALDPASEGMHKIGNYLGYSGSYAAARDLQRLVAEARETSLGAEHSHTLNARADLARWTGRAGDPTAARDQYAALLPVQEQVLGAEHPGTLTDREYLARWTGEAGDAASARDQYTALLPIRERVQRPEHPDTLTTRRELARWTGQAGDAAGARDQFAALLPIAERVHGPQHPDTLTTRHELAYWTGEAGDAAGARDQFVAQLPTRERVQGPEHPDTLTTRAHLARWTGHAGDAAGARDQFAALLLIAERVHGPEHPSTLVARHELAYWTGQAGDAAGARDQFAALLPIRERVQGPEHRGALFAQHELAHWTGEVGDAAGACDQFAALLPIRERVLGPEHPDTLTTRRELARWTGQAGNAAGACDQFAALLPIAERVLGPQHPDTLTTRANLTYWTGQAEDAAADVS